MDKGKAVAVAVEEPFSANTTTPPTPQIPAFSGKDAYLWVTRVDNIIKYFQANPTMNDGDKVQAVIAAFKGTASTWFHLYWKVYNATPLTWPTLKNAVLHRFQPEAVNNPILVLLNIRQTGTLAEYRDLFETLTHSQPLRSPSPHLTLSDETLRAIFLNGLKEDLKVQLKSREVKFLSDLMCMAQLIEDRREDGRDQERGAKLMKLWGKVFGREVIVLVASGASHSLIASRLVKEMGLLVSECDDDDEAFVFWDGPPVKSQGTCRRVLVKVHEDLPEMVHDFFVFEDLGGNQQVVLGFDWLLRLGKVSANYTNLTMKLFVASGKEITLKGNPSLTLPDQCRVLRVTRLNK